MRDQERGFSLVETVMAIAVIAILGAAFVTALTTASRVLFLTDEKETAKNLAESQMEFVTRQSYDASGRYTPAPVSSEYAGYSVEIPPAVTVSPANATVQMQKITIIISRNGRQYPLEDYKIGR